MGLSSFGSLGFDVVFSLGDSGIQIVDFSGQLFSLGNQDIVDQFLGISDVSGGFINQIGQSSDFLVVFIGSGIKFGMFSFQDVFEVTLDFYDHVD